jgi:hypothetical protein
MNLVTAMPPLWSFFETSNSCQTVAFFLLYLFVRFFLALGDEPLASSGSTRVAGGGKSSTKYIGALENATAAGNNTQHSSLSLRVTKATHAFKAHQIAPPFRSSVSGPSAREQPNDIDDDSFLLSSVSLLEDLELELEKACPDSTFAERRRFLIACSCNLQEASDRLHHYLEWRQKYTDIRSENETAMRVQPTNDQDYDIWVEACLIAMKTCGEVENVILPRVIRTYKQKVDAEKAQRHGHDGNSNRCTDEQSITDKDGHRIFHIIPAMMDDKLAKQSTYTLAVALYLDRVVDHSSMETVTLCLDVRAGRGWPNAHAVRLVPFMKNSLKILLPLFPERLHKCIVFPLPSTFFYIWTMISKCLDPITAAKICVVSGRCKIEASPPMEKLDAHLGGEQALLLEVNRVASFKV